MFGFQPLIFWVPISNFGHGVVLLHISRVPRWQASHAFQAKSEEAMQESGTLTEGMHRHRTILAMVMGRHTFEIRVLGGWETKKCQFWRWHIGSCWGEFETFRDINLFWVFRIWSYCRIIKKGHPNENSKFMGFQLLVNLGFGVWVCWSKNLGRSLNVPRSIFGANARHTAWNQLINTPEPWMLRRWFLFNSRWNDFFFLILLV